jgi:hypothetical protein
MAFQCFVLLVYDVVTRFSLLVAMNCAYFYQSCGGVIYTRY